MNKSLIEESQPEQKPNSEQKTDDISVCPSIANAVLADVWSKFNVKLSWRELEALMYLRNNSINKPITAAYFAQLMWPNSSIHTKISNTGNGACSGKAAWLCGGSYLGKLKKKKLVEWAYSPTGYYLTQLAREILHQIELNIFRAFEKQKRFDHFSIVDVTRAFYREFPVFSNIR
jgi:hypothetical protein